MKYVFPILLWLMLPISIFAQSNPSPTVPPLPSGPLIKRAPDFSKWIVSYQRAGAQKQPVKASTGENPEEKDPSKLIPFKQVVVTKTGTTICEQVINERGETFAVWHDGGRRLVLKGKEDPLVTETLGTTDMQTVDFSSADFSGFGWITPGAYAGIQNVLGRDCMVFRGEIDPATPQEMFQRQLYAQMQERNASANGQAIPSNSVVENYKVPIVACIDLETRLPVILTFGRELPETRLFKFQSAPTSRLILPPVLKEYGEKYNQRFKDLSRHPSPP